MPREIYPLDESPQYTEEIEKLMNTDPVLAESGFFYSLILRILNNIKAVYQRAVPVNREINGHALGENITLTKADIGLGNVDNTADADKSVGSAASASTSAKLTTARTIGISGGATGTATSFDGSANITIPVTALDVSKAAAGTLPVTRGGTGATSLANITVGKANACNGLTFAVAAAAPTTVTNNKVTFSYG